MSKTVTLTIREYEQMGDEVERLRAENDKLRDDYIDLMTKNELLHADLRVSRNLNSELKKENETWRYTCSTGKPPNE